MLTIYFQEVWFSRIYKYFINISNKRINLRDNFDTSIKLHVIINIIIVEYKYCYDHRYNQKCYY